MCFPIHHKKRLSETLKLPRLSGGSRSISEAATSRLDSEGLVHIPANKAIFRTVAKVIHRHLARNQ